MKILGKYLILLTKLKLFIYANEIKEKELVKISTGKSESIQYKLAENINNYNNLFIQVILCQNPSSDNHISIINSQGESIVGLEIEYSQNFILGLQSQSNNNITINASSSYMYIQYQYIEAFIDVIRPSGKIKDYKFETNFVSFYMSPVVNNTKTSYDLYYLGKINVHNEICQKIDFILNNEPISTITYNGTNYFDLKFENIENKTGYYLIKGNNVDGVSYYYFYERINVVNRLGPYPTKNAQFFEIEEKSDEYYTVFTTPGNINKNKYLNIQIILCQNFGEQKSHMQIFNQDNEEIFFTDIITGRQLSLDIPSVKNITIVATSPHMFIQYQFTDFYRYILPYTCINSYDFNSEEKYLYFNITPIMDFSSSFYELYYSKNKSSIEKECQMLKYTLDNKPVSSVNVFAKEFADVKFKLEGKWFGEKGYVFIKNNNMNETNYTYFYDIVEVEGKESSISTLLWVFVYGVAGLCAIAFIIVIVIIIKQGCCKREKDEQPGSISLINRNTIL